MSDTSFRTDRAGKEHRPGWPPAGEAPSGEENFRATRKFEPQPSGAAKLRIKVGQCGAELPRTDAVGEPDPYVRVTVGPCSAVTEVKAEEASQPAWDQALDLQVDEGKTALQLAQDKGLGDVVGILREAAATSTLL